MFEVSLVLHNTTELEVLTEICAGKSLSQMEVFDTSEILGKTLTNTFRVSVAVHPKPFVPETTIDEAPICGVK